MERNGCSPELAEAGVVERNFFRRGGMKGRRQRRRRSPREPVKTSNLILLALGLFALGFIIAMTVIFCLKGAVPDTLIQYTLGAGGVEALLLAGIKISKVVSGAGNAGEREEDI